MARKGRGRRNARQSDDALPANPDAELYKKTSINPETLEDNSEDEFYKQRGNVALGDLGGSSRRQDSDSEQEVFALDGVDSDDDDDDSEEDEDEALLERLRSYGVRPKSEVQDDEDDDDDADAAAARAKAADLSGGWGKSRRAYYDADDVSEEEDAKEEEKEALRLQKEQLGGLAEDDFLEDSFENLLKKKRGADSAGSGTGAAAAAAAAASLDLDDAATAEQIKPDLSRMSDPEKLKLVRTSHPDVVSMLKEFSATLAELRDEPVDVIPEDPNAVAQLARYLYLTNIAFYFALAANSDIQTRKSHPVVEQMAQLQELVSATSAGLEAGIAALNSDDNDDDEEMDDEDEEQDEQDEEGGSDVGDDSEEAQDDEDIQMLAAPSKKSKSASKKETKRKAGSLARAAPDADDFGIPVESYNDVVVPKSGSKRKRSEAAADNDFGEGTTITEADLADKAKRTKSLKFLVNQIGQSVANLGTRRKKTNPGGDDDIPIRDARASQKAAQDKALRDQQKGRGEYDDEESFGEDDDDDDAAFGNFGRKKDAGGDGSDGEDGHGQDDADEDGEMLYEQMAAQQKKRRSAREARIEMARAEMEFDGDEALPEDAKRQATWKILTNKGLTPHRKKENRNPRVKKRMKYEAAKKKLSSVRRVAVDKSKLGSYAGERTGINVNRSSSVKFS
ncbi:something about silencing protein 10 [Polyrhizophydium stewartii]|uniref:Something about silencing protein 10 n=1 Tax=Polyrhizophydium stewartii TaxID=2732419 RepID=A0ABR4NJL9_9FUNG